MAISSSWTNIFVLHVAGAVRENCCCETVRKWRLCLHLLPAAFKKMRHFVVKLLCKTPSKAKQTRPRDLNKNISLWEAGYPAYFLHTHPTHPWPWVIAQHRHVNSDHMNRTISLLDKKFRLVNIRQLHSCFDHSVSSAINSEVIFIWSSHCLTINLCQCWLSKYGLYVSLSHHETLNSTYITHF